MISEPHTRVAVSASLVVVVNFLTSPLGWGGSTNTKPVEDGDDCEQNETERYVYCLHDSLAWPVNNTSGDVGENCCSNQGVNHLHRPDKSGWPSNSVNDAPSGGAPATDGDGNGNGTNWGTNGDRLGDGMNEAADAPMSDAGSGLDSTEFQVEVSVAMVAKPSWGLAASSFTDAKVPRSSSQTCRRIQTRRFIRSRRSRIFQCEFAYRLAGDALLSSGFHS